MMSNAEAVPTPPDPPAEAELVANGMRGKPAASPIEPLVAAVALPDAIEDLPRLMHGAAWARRFVEMHGFAARQCLRAARHARDAGDIGQCRKFLLEAKDERAQARKCSRFARECEWRAECLAIATGVHPAVRTIRTVRRRP